MESIQYALHYILHIDQTLLAFVSSYGGWAYGLLFVLVFCETGLVVTPFLPGDSLLFAAGSIAANVQHALSIQALFLLLMLASILGNKLNYLIGRAIGPKVFRSNSRLLNQKYLLEAHQFYEKHGGKTIIFARFIPIIRTFAPFIAGVGAMSVREFSFYNVVSAVLWVGCMLGAGYFFGTMPLVKNNFSLVIYAIIGISLLPPLIAFFCRKIQTSQSS